MNDENINTRTAKKGIVLETTLCRNGVINCWSELGSGNAHSVHLKENGGIDRCTCKGWKFHGHCYHTDAIRVNRPLRMAAQAAMKADTDTSEDTDVSASNTDSSANETVLADGGYYDLGEHINEHHDRPESCSCWGFGDVVALAKPKRPCNTCIDAGFTVPAENPDNR